MDEGTGVGVSGVGGCVSAPQSVKSGRWKTSNVQHRTSNAEVSEDSLCHSMFGVGCSSGFMERPPRTLIAPCALVPTHRPLAPSPSPPAGGWGPRVPAAGEVLGPLA